LEPGKPKIEFINSSSCISIHFRIIAVELNSYRHPFAYGAAQGLVAEKAFIWLANQNNENNNGKNFDIDSVSLVDKRTALSSLAV
jgi:hypothetical protein